MIAGCTGDDLAVNPPRAVEEPRSGGTDGRPPLRVGLIVNSASPTAVADDAMRLAVSDAVASTDGRILIEEIRIDDLSDVDGAIRALVERGVSTILTSCEDRSVVDVAERAVDAGLLVVTGCVALPRADMDGLDDPLFADLAGLDDDAAIVATAIDEQGWDRPLVLSSTLVADVEDLCGRVDAELRSRDADPLDAASWVGLIDDPNTVATELTPALEDAGVVVVCGLGPAVAALIPALREAADDTPILVTWPGADLALATDVPDVWVLAPDAPSSEQRPTDVVSADAIAVLDAAAARAGSTGSIRLSEVIRRYEWRLPTSTLAIDDSGAVSGRSWSLSRLGADGGVDESTFIVAR